MIGKLVSVIGLMMIGVEAKTVPKYVESLLERNSTIAEYFVCASSLQTSKAQEVMIGIKDYVEANNKTEEAGRKIVDKIFIKAALNCIKQFRNESSSSKISLLNLTMETSGKGHLETFFNVDHQRVLDEGNFELNDVEMKYKDDVTKIQQKQRIEKNQAQKEKQSQKMVINQTLEELKQGNKRIETLLREKVAYVQEEKVIHHGILTGVLCSILPTLLCHYCLCWGSESDPDAEENSKRMQREVDKEGKIYTKEFDAVEKKRKVLAEKVQKKFGMDLKAFLESKRAVKEQPTEGNGEEGPRDRGKGKK